MVLTLPTERSTTRKKGLVSLNRGSAISKCALLKRYSGYLSPRPRSVLANVL